MSEPTSPAAAVAAAIADFDRVARFSCSCTPREIRVEAGRVECGRCGRPVYVRRATEPR